MIRKRSESKSSSDETSQTSLEVTVSPMCPRVKRSKKEGDSVSAIEKSFKDTISAIGEDLERQGLVKTPLRAAKAMVDLTSGYKMDLKDVVNEAVFEAESQDMVVVRDIPFHSLCEHHVLPFYGRVHVGYVPRDTILGISKFARIVNMYAKRLQIQERLTSKIAQAIQQTLNPLGAVVVVEASHMCMEMRGVQKIGSITSTCSKLGVFQGGQSEHAKEFWAHIRR